MVLECKQPVKVIMFHQLFIVLNVTVCFWLTGGKGEKNTLLFRSHPSPILFISLESVTQIVYKAKNIIDGGSDMKESFYISQRH